MSFLAIELMTTKPKRGGPGRGQQGKPCSKCGERKPLEAFHSDGKGGKRANCSTCKNADNAVWNAGQKAKTKKLIADARSVGCLICGETDQVVLDFHHRGNVKKDDHVMRMAGRRISIERVRAELDKCVVLCANCHRRVHAGTAKI